MFFTYKGPAKTTPTLENARSSDTRNEGRGRVGGELKALLCIFLHVTHLESKSFTGILYPLLDYPEMSSGFSKRFSNAIVILIFMTLPDYQFRKMLFSWKQDWTFRRIR